MILIDITQNQIERAKKLYDFAELKGSISGGKGNLYGALGEIIVYDTYQANGFEVDFNSNYDYDMVIQGYKVDVKTKRTNFEPLPHFLCNISTYNTKQQCDYYFFLSINENLKDCYMVGYKAKAEFFDQATYNQKGTHDVNGWVFKDDCYSMQIGMLNKFNFINNGKELHY
jgi:hypothetical protein